MRIDVVTFSSGGGAGSVASSLVAGFNEVGLPARLLIATSSNLRAQPLERPMLTFSAAMDNYLLKKPSWQSHISLIRDKHSVLDIRESNSDLTVFRWMNGLLGDRFLAKEQSLGRIAWGLDDMNPFTGTCHYSGECRNFVSGCNSCPALRTPFSGLPKKSLAQKKSFVEKYNPTFVAPTDWIQDEFRASILASKANHLKISNPINPLFFQTSGETHKSKRPFGPISILVVAANLDDPTKGLFSILPTLKYLSESKNHALTMVGRSGKRLKESLPAGIFLGPLAREDIRFQMESADILLVPSLFENAGSVVAEAASQGTPAIARRVGGMPEMTGYGKHGYLFDSEEELRQILDSITSRQIKEKAEIAVEWSQNFTPRSVALSYAEAFLK